MIIVHRGTLPEELMYKGTCMSCMSRMEAKHIELTHTDSQRDGATHSANCPVCLSAGRTRPVYFQRIIT